MHLLDTLIHTNEGASIDESINADYVNMRIEIYMKTRIHIRNAKYR
jgi:hypothetical protein